MLTFEPIGTTHLSQCSNTHIPFRTPTKSTQLCGTMVAALLE